MNMWTPEIEKIGMVINLGKIKINIMLKQKIIIQLNIKTRKWNKFRSLNA